MLRTKILTSPVNIPINIEAVNNENSISIRDIGDIKQSLNEPICFININDSEIFWQETCMTTIITMPGTTKFK